jgi:hypothetical protein
MMTGEMYAHVAGRLGLPQPNGAASAIDAVTTRRGVAVFTGRSLGGRVISTEFAEPL